MKKNRSGASGFFRKFIHHKMALVGLVILVLEVIAVLVLPPLLKLDPYTIDPRAFSSPPTPAHVMGTDEVGRDMLARIVYGGRISLFVGISSAVLSVLIGLPLGLIAGYYRGILGAVIMRAADIFMSFPTMVLMLVLVAIYKPSVPTIIVTIGVLGWTQSAKLIYGNVLSVRNKEYVEAAKASGTSNLMILLRYILPNSIAPLWMAIAFRTSSAIITESSLSFLGAGVQPPAASWGNIIFAAQSLPVLTSKPWIWLPTGILLLVTVICVNLVGEGLRDALDPKMKR